MNERLLSLLLGVLEEFRKAKPEERSEEARRHAVTTITELEKVIAYFKTFVVDK